MSDRTTRRRSDLSVYVYEPQCNGCVTCVRACPVKAIRIKGDKAVILPELCVDCGECIRVCPQKAVIPRVSTHRDLARFKITVLLPSPVLYTQFGEDVLPNDVLVALRTLGFDHVYDLAKYCEWGALAGLAWAAEHPEARPALSPVCPVVTRLVARRFPHLIKHLIPILPPREVANKHIRQRLRRKLGLADRDIGVFHVTPCAAKLADIRDPGQQRSSELDGALSMFSLYADVLKALERLSEDDMEAGLFQAGGYGIDWDAGGSGQVERTLSVSGLAGTLEVLEQIESGRLRDLDYVDCRVCQDGCLGGPLTVENRYLARVTLRRLVGMFGNKPRVRRKEIAALLKEGFFDSGQRIEPDTFPLDQDPFEAMKKLKKVDDLTARLPGKLCAVCGAPDCRTLAEDVVQGRADLFVCPVFFRLRTWGRHKMKLSEIVEKLNLKVLAGAESLDREATGVYAGDLLSDVMAHSRTGQVWVTLQGHLNVVAVAALKELSGLILINGREPAEDALAKAEEEGLPILQSDLGAYELCGQLYSLMAG